MASRLGVLTSVICICATFAFAQTTNNTSNAGSPQTVTAPTVGAPGVLGGILTSSPGPVGYTTYVGQVGGPGVIDAPYSAEYVSESVRVLADGTRITNTQPNEKIYRDSQGRTRRERAMISGQPGVVSPIIAEIRDPVAGVAYVLDSENKVAHRVKLQPYPNTSPNTAAPQRPRTVSTTRPPVYNVSTTNVSSDGTVRKSEHLGFKTVEGVEVQGSRTTTTYPAGFQGADRPITAVQELWTAPYFDRPVLSQTSDPRSGETLSKLVNISTTEPDPLLFMPPAGWAVVDEEGPQVRIPVKR